MEKCYSLVPVSTSTQVVVTGEEHNGSTLDIQEVEQQNLSEIEELEGEIERLEFEKEMTEVRVTSTREYLEKRYEDLVDEVEELIAAVELKLDDESRQAQKEDREPEYESEADDDEEATVDEDDESVDDGLEEQDRQAGTEYLKKCRKIYYAIAAGTHPDRCGSTSKVNFFLEAKKALEAFNLEWLEDIYFRVFHKRFGKTSLIEKLIALRRQKSDLESEILSLKQTSSWALHLIEIQEGREAAAQRFEVGLKSKRDHLRAILNGDYSQCEF